MENEGLSVLRLLENIARKNGCKLYSNINFTKLRETLS